MIQKWSNISTFGRDLLRRNGTLSIWGVSGGWDPLLPTIATTDHIQQKPFSGHDSCHLLFHHLISTLERSHQFNQSSILHKFFPLQLCTISCASLLNEIGLTEWTSDTHVSISQFWALLSSSVSACDNSNPEIETLLIFFLSGIIYLQGEVFAPSHN